MSTANKTVLIFTDGACSGNPGPGGWAALLRYGAKEKIISGGQLHTTNNRMELTAAIAALQTLKRSCVATVVTDSRYVQRGMTEWLPKWRKKNLLHANSKIKNVDLWLQLIPLCELHQVSWKWVRGHSGHTENEIVDQLARDAIPKL